MLNISDYQTGVVGLFASETDAIASASSRDIAVIDAHIYGVVLGRNQTSRLGRRLINIGDISLARVRILTLISPRAGAPTEQFLK